MTVFLTNKVESTLRLTADAGSSLDALNQSKEKLIYYTALPGITIPTSPVPIVITPVLDLTVGCELAVTTKIQVPFVSYVEAGYEMIWDLDKPPGDRYRFKEYSNITPIKMSDPDVFQAVGATASAWIESALSLVVEGIVGPRVAVKIKGDFGVHPFANPWWNIDANLILSGGLTLGGVGIPPEPSGEAPIKIWSLFHKDSGGPIISPPSGSTSNPYQKASGQHLRWARATKWNNFLPASGSICRVRGTAEDTYATVATASGHVTLLKVDGTGNVLWTRGVSTSAGKSTGTMDGGVLLAGSSGQKIHLFKYSGTGSLLWQKVYTASISTSATMNVVRILCHTHPTTGAEQFYVAGQLTNDEEGGSLDLDPILIKLDTNGDPLLVKTYNSLNATRVEDLIITPDQQLLWVGHCKLSENGNLPGPGSMNHGWLQKTNLDGTAQWGTISTSDKGNTFRSATVAPDGTIYTIGKLELIVNTLYGSLQVTRHDSNGLTIDAVTVSQSPLSQLIQDTTDSASINLTNPGDTGATQWLTASGNSVFDQGISIHWADSGLLIAGNTGLGSDRAFLTGCLSDNLSVRWLTCHERLAGDDQVYDTVLTDDGWALLGYSANMLQVATGGTTNNTCALLCKLPRDGKVDLHPSTQTVNRYLQPGLHDHSSLSDPYLEELGYYAGRMKEPGTLTIPDVSRNLTPATPFSSHIFITPTLTHWVPLETGNPNTPMTYAQWAAFHFLPAGSDGMHQDYDGDGRTNGEEWYFGGTPITSEPTKPQLTLALGTGNTWSLSFPRNKAAAGQLPLLTTSTDLINWSVLSTGILTQQALDINTDLLRFSLSRANEPWRFYQIQPQ